MDLEEVLEQAYLLPTIPAVVHELLSSFDRSNIDVDTIASKVALDQVIAGKVLRMANSAQFSRGRRVGSIHDAVMVLGFNRLRTLVIASGTSSMKPDLPCFDHAVYWRHNLQTGCFARTLGELVNSGPEECFVAGLMHGIGQLLLRSVEPDTYAGVDRACAGGAHRDEAERAALGLDHCAVGGALAREWGLPAPIAGAIEHYCAPLPQLPDNRMPAVLALATMLAEATHHTAGNDLALAALPRDIVTAIGLDLTAVAAEMDSVREESTAWFALLGG